MSHKITISNCKYRPAKIEIDNNDWYFLNNLLVKKSTLHKSTITAMEKIENRAFGKAIEESKALYNSFINPSNSIIQLTKYDLLGEVNVYANHRENKITFTNKEWFSYDVAYTKKSDYIETTFNSNNIANSLSPDDISIMLAPIGYCDRFHCKELLENIKELERKKASRLTRMQKVINSISL